MVVVVVVVVVVVKSMESDHHRPVDDGWLDAPMDGRPSRGWRTDKWIEMLMDVLDK